jgi:rhodanese-related sulfurtransferase
MHKCLIFLPVLLVIITFTLPAEDREKRIDFAELQRLITEQSQEYILVDVRTKSEYESGYIPTAINIPHSTIAENLPTEDRCALIILYCQSGRRSGMAKETLESLGFENVFNFGGINDWKGKLENPK